MADSQKEVPKPAPWVLIARAEGEDSFYPEEERITLDMLKAMARSFDPSFRRVYVVCGWEEETGTSGPGHWQGEYNRPVGEVIALRVKNGGLEAQFEEFMNGDNEPAITSLIEDGFRERSIRWWPRTPELPGHPPYLRHVAILGAEPPGIHSMPALTEYFRTAEVVPGLQEWVRGSSLTAPTMERTLSESTKKRTAPPAPREEVEMTPEQIAELIRTTTEAAVTRAQSGIEASVKAAFEAQLPQQIKAVSEGIAEVRALADEAKKAADETKETISAVRAEATSASMARRIDSLKTSGRVTPADADAFAEMLRDLPAEKAEAQLSKLEARTPQINRLRSAVPTYTAEVAALGDASRYAPPDGVNIDPISAAITARARAEAAKAGAEGSEEFRVAFAAAAYRISAELEN